MVTCEDYGRNEGPYQLYLQHKRQKDYKNTERKYFQKQKGKRENENVNDTSMGKCTPQLCCMKFKKK